MDGGIPMEDKRDDQPGTGAAPTPAATARGDGRVRLWTRDLVLIILVNFCVFTNHIMTLSTFPYFVVSLGGNEAMAGLCAAFFSVVAVVVRPVVGWWLDNGARRAVLVAGLLVMGLAPLGYVFVPVLSVVIALRMVHGAGLSLSNSTTATVASDVIAKPRFAEGMGYFGMATALASAVAPALGLSIMEAAGFGVLYVTVALVTALGLVLFCFVRVPRPNVTERRPFRLADSINREALPATTVAMVFMFTFGALENFVAIYATQAGLPSGSLYFVVMSVVLLLVRVFLGRLVDRRGEAFFVYSCNAAMFVALLLLALVPSTPAFLASGALAGYAFGGIEPSLQSMAVHTSTDETRGSANATFLCGYDIGYALGGGVSGALITAVGYGPMWAIVSMAALGSVAVYVLWARHSDTSFSKALAAGRR